MNKAKIEASNEAQSIPQIASTQASTKIGGGSGSNSITNFDNNDADSYSDNYKLKKANIYYGIPFFLFSIICFIIINVKNDWLCKTTKIEKNTQFFIGASFTYRITFALFVWYILHSLITIRNPDLVDSCQFNFHIGLMFLHYLVLIVFVVVSMTIPDRFFEIWCSISMFLGGVFLLFQLISFIDLMYDFSNYLSSSTAPDFVLYLIFLLVCGGCIAFFVCSFIFFKCDISTIINSICLVLCILIVVISCWKEIALVGGFCALYIGYILFTGFLCHEECSSFSNSKRSTTLVVASSIFTLVWLIYSSFSLSKNAEIFKCSDDDGFPDFSLSFFHLVGSCASAYVGLILTNWGDGPSGSNWTIGAGKTPMIVNIVVAFGAMALFSWIIVAPYVCTCRNFES